MEEEEDRCVCSEGVALFVSCFVCELFRCVCEFPCRFVVFASLLASFRIQSPRSLHLYLPPSFHFPFTMNKRVLQSPNPGPFGPPVFGSIFATTDSNQQRVSGGGNV